MNGVIITSHFTKFTENIAMKIQIKNSNYYTKIAHFLSVQHYSNLLFAIYRIV